VTKNTNDFKATFAALIETFIRATIDGKVAAQELANMAISVFADNGDLSYAETFIKAMNEHGKDYVRKQAFLAWLAFHSPVQVDDNGNVVEPLKKDKSEDAREFAIAEALAVSFWAFKPETPIKMFYAESVVSAMRQSLKKFGGDKWEAGSEAARDLVRQANKAITDFEANVVNKTEEVLYEDIEDEKTLLTPVLDALEDIVDKIVDDETPEETADGEEPLSEEDQAVIDQLVADQAADEAADKTAA
jgi:hypothetical protein